MRRICVYYSANGSGVDVDADLIHTSLANKHKTDKFDFKHLDTGCSLTPFNLPPQGTYDIGIWIQDFDECMLDCNRVNVLVVNEEWLQDTEKINKHFDCVIVKSDYARTVVEPALNNVVVLPFWSRDLWRPDYNNNEISHALFNGQAIQKNMECVIDNTDIHIFDSSARYTETRDTNYHTQRLSTDKLSHIYNLCNTHICPSLYEAHGHYMYEALLCDKTVIATRLPQWEELVDQEHIHFIDVEREVQHNTDYEFLRHSEHYPFRRGFECSGEHLDELINDNTLQRKSPRAYIIDRFTKHKKQFVSFIQKL